MASRREMDQKQDYPVSGSFAYQRGGSQRRGQKPKTPNQNDMPDIYKNLKELTGFDPRTTQAKETPAEETELKEGDK